MFINGASFGFCMKMLNGRHLHTAGGDAESLILEDLKLGYVVGSSVFSTWQIATLINSFLKKDD